ncbi:hypothetical protein DYB26_008225, partial [Aphanomyces astaci]
FQLITTEELTKEKMALEQTTKALKCEIQVHLDKELEYAKYGQKQTREIKQLQVRNKNEPILPFDGIQGSMMECVQAKVKTLEKSLCQVVHEFEKEKQLLTTKTEKEV